MASAEIGPVFQELSKALPHELSLMGGKAAALAVLLQKNFPVPPGAALFQQPQTSEVLMQISQWWQQQGAPPVAVRSSGSGEDGSEVSYAGQFVTILNVKTEEALFAAIKTCFEAVHRTASQTYASHFQQVQIPMHVLIQRMINSQFAGVYFSVDPRTENSSWLIEVVEGQGEQLVSGQVTPFRFTADSAAKNPPKNWKKEYLDQVVHWGQEVEKTFGYKADMEWAIDGEGKFWILQSRPITAKAFSTSRRQTLNEEWLRLTQTSPSDSAWDGHTFAEWTGVPTELSYDIWQKAFQKDYAFDRALKSLGYEGFGKSDQSHFSLLERVFGRAYLNLKLLEPIYFGKSPYRLMLFPRPHLEFCWAKLTPTVIARTPLGIAQMIKVAWTIQTGRSELAKKALSFVKNISTSGPDSLSLFNQCQNLDWEEQRNELKKLAESFAKDSLQGTFLLTLLIESTIQGLLALLTKDLGKEKAAESIQLLTGRGLQTLANKMNQEFFEIQDSEKSWQTFLSHYGHRGVGELDLSHPRWLETSRPQYKKNPSSAEPQKNHAENILPELLQKISSLRRPVFEHEWQELQKLMEMREVIKMEVMKPYAQIRWLTLAIGRSLGLLNDEIFWLTLDEILALKAGQDIKPIRSLILQRKEKAQFMRSVDLPMLFSLQELKAVLNEQPHNNNSPVITGVSLSPGISNGVVHFVSDPENEDLNSWPDDLILVAEATDPGWTPLFAKAKAVIVSRGGVLSHCAIVAREMGLPAVGEIRAVQFTFKEGERVWVDGNNGTIRRTN